MALLLKKIGIPVLMFLCSGIITTIVYSSHKRPFSRPKDPVYAVCYSPFRDGQSPEYNSFPTQEQIEEDLILLAPITDRIRTYGNDKILYKIPDFCDNAPFMQLDVGAWLGPLPAYENFNKQSIENLINIANSGHFSVQSLIVGNEAINSGYLSKQELINYISQVRNSTSLPVTTAEPWNIWQNNRDLANYVDYVMIHIHPYWEGKSVTSAANYVVQRWQEMTNLFKGKEVVIGETGWPTQGATFGNAVPSEENQALFVKQFIELAEKYNIKYFLFEGFDEKWKEKYGTVEGHWGIFYSSRTMKPLLEEILK